MKQGYYVSYRVIRSMLTLLVRSTARILAESWTENFKQTKEHSSSKQLFMFNSHCCELTQCFTIEEVTDTPQKKQKLIQGSSCSSAILVKNLCHASPAWERHNQRFRSCMDHLARAQTTWFEVFGTRKTTFSQRLKRLSYHRVRRCKAGLNRRPTMHTRSLARQSGDSLH